ncbi:FitA-like ribbon-helix-helix domain-containing protein [Azotobacter vinelandii]|uniref:FitA-like ribbon-helix-helix domain-containing protein n=1 Tax=Azotobacter vinelandii TaxID=354 RepID=UPI002666F2E5|nr:Arc family DNA-binding protein [Azotobacter vinelandii]WKN20577.1 Arc family DNA-binding protein [Azotobacter vinelandii]
MPSITVRNVPDEVHRAIRVRAAQHGRSIEAEMRDILETAVRPQGRVKLGSLLSEIGRKVKLTEEEFAIFESARDKTPARAANFE